MVGRQILPFITDVDLFRCTKNLLVYVQGASLKADEKLYKNTVDPFSALFAAFLQDISYNQWLELEKVRQIQKDLENCLGEFHQDILSSMPGWERAKAVIDIHNMGKKIIAEVKNKHNTTKGNHKKSIYDDLEASIESHYHGFTGYYVEVIPKARELYDKPFTPSDNVTHTRRPTNGQIRVIDGASFYSLASGYPAALRMLFEVLPTVIGDILKADRGAIEDRLRGGQFTKLFGRAYKL